MYSLQQSITVNRRKNWNNLLVIPIKYSLSETNVSNKTKMSGNPVLKSVQQNRAPCTTILIATLISEKGRDKKSELDRIDTLFKTFKCLRSQILCFLFFFFFYTKHNNLLTSLSPLWKRFTDSAT